MNRTEAHIALNGRYPSICERYTTRSRAILIFMARAVVPYPLPRIRLPGYGFSIWELPRRIRNEARCEYCGTGLGMPAESGYTYACGPCGSMTIKYEP